MGNLITTAAAFFLGSRGHLDVWLFTATVAGLFFVIASACVFNNYIDRIADGKMERTKHRALARGLISGRSALGFAIILGLVGACILGCYTNLWAFFSAVVGFFIYVVLYSFWKYRTMYATLVGSIAGAIPPVVGYCAASNRFDLGAFILFLILVCWQMPHFFSISMYRFDDYKAASIPVLPTESGAFATKRQILCYIIAFMVATLMLPLFGYVGYIYLIGSSLLGIAWLRLGIKGFSSDNDHVWARKMFRFSLVVIMGMSAMISFDGILG